MNTFITRNTIPDYCYYYYYYYYSCCCYYYYYYYYCCSEDRKGTLFPWSPRESIMIMVPVGAWL